MLTSGVSMIASSSSTPLYQQEKQETSLFPLFSSVVLEKGPCSNEDNVLVSYEEHEVFFAEKIQEAGRDREAIANIVSRIKYSDNPVVRASVPRLLTRVAFSCYREGRWDCYQSLIEVLNESCGLNQPYGDKSQDDECVIMRLCSLNETSQATWYAENVENTGNLLHQIRSIASGEGTEHVEDLFVVLGASLAQGDIPKVRMVIDKEWKKIRTLVGEMLFRVFVKSVLFPALLHSLRLELAYELWKADGNFEFSETMAEDRQDNCQLGKCFQCWLTKEKDCKSNFLGEILIKVVKYGHIDMLRYILEKEQIDMHLAEELVLDAAFHGHTDEVQWLWEQYSFSDSTLEKALLSASRHGYDDLFCWLLTKGSISDETRQATARIAVEEGHIGILDLLLQQASLPEEDRQDLIWNAKRWMHFEIVYILTTGVLPEDYVLNPLLRAMQGGLIDRMQALLKRTVLSETTLAFTLHKAIEGRHSEALSFLLRQRSLLLPEHIEDLAEQVAKEGNMEMVKLFFSEPLRSWLALSLAICAAADLGHTDVVRFLLMQEGQEELREEDWLAAVALASVGGHLGTFQVLVDWARDVRGRREDFFRDKGWTLCLRKRRTTNGTIFSDEDLIGAFELAKNKGHTNVMRRLLEEKTVSGRSLEELVRRRERAVDRRRDILFFFVNNKVREDEELMRIFQDHLEGAVVFEEIVERFSRYAKTKS